MTLDQARKITGRIAEAAAILDGVWRDLGDEATVPLADYAEMALEASCCCDRLRDRTRAWLETLEGEALEAAKGGAR